MIISNICILSIDLFVLSPSGWFILLYITSLTRFLLFWIHGRLYLFQFSYNINWIIQLKPINGFNTYIANYLKYNVTTNKTLNRFSMRVIRESSKYYTRNSIIGKLCDILLVNDSSSSLIEQSMNVTSATKSVSSTKSVQSVQTKSIVESSTSVKSVSSSSTRSQQSVEYEEAIEYSD